MKPFIRTDQYNFIREQTRKLVNGHSTVNDVDVIKALESMVLEYIIAMFLDLSEDQKQLLLPVVEVHDKEMAEKFLANLKQYVVPFSTSDQAIRKIFPKVKKLTVPSLDKMDLRDVVYLSWFDNNTGKKYIVSNFDNKLSGIYGSFTQLNQKGVCSLCNSIGEVGMFLAEIKGKEQGTFIKRGNYICSDSQKCNENLTSLDKLSDFIEHLKG